MPLGPYPEHLDQPTIPYAPEAKVELTSEEMMARHNSLWDEGDKIGALESVLGRYINASEIKDNPIYQTIMLSHSSAEAFGATLMVKTIEDAHDKTAE